MTSPSNGKIRAALERIMFLASDPKSPVMDAWDAARAWLKEHGDDGASMPRDIMESGLSEIYEFALEALSSPPEPIGGEASDEPKMTLALEGSPAPWAMKGDGYGDFWLEDASGTLVAAVDDLNAMADIWPALILAFNKLATAHRTPQPSSTPEGEAVRVAIAALERARKTMLGIDVFVRSKQKIKEPEGWDWWDAEQDAVEDALTALRRSGEGV